LRLQLGGDARHFVRRSARCSLGDRPRPDRGRAWLVKRCATADSPLATPRNGEKEKTQGNAAPVMGRRAAGVDFRNSLTASASPEEKAHSGLAGRSGPDTRGAWISRTSGPFTPTAAEVACITKNSKVRVHDLNRGAAVLVFSRIVIRIRRKNLLYGWSSARFLMHARPLAMSWHHPNHGFPRNIHSQLSSKNSRRPRQRRFVP
jgi:hypothetical protein